MSSVFPKRRFGRLLASFRERDFPRACYRGCSYFFMFRPHSLHASQIAPTAASEPAGQPRLLHPSRTCVVTFARIGYAIRPTTGNWRNEDFHLARFAALSAAHSSSKLLRTRHGEFLNWRRIRHLGTMPECAIWSSLFVPLVVTIARLTRPGGIRSVVAESILIKHAPDPQSQPKTCPESKLSGSDHRGFLRCFHPQGSAHSVGCHCEHPRYCISMIFCE